jgi:hypothetical protein
VRGGVRAGCSLGPRGESGCIEWRREALEFRLHRRQLTGSPSNAVLSATFLGIRARRRRGAPRAEGCASVPVAFYEVMTLIIGRCRRRLKTVLGTLAKETQHSLDPLRISLPLFSLATLRPWMAGAQPPAAPSLCAPPDRSARAPRLRAPPWSAQARAERARAVTPAWRRAVVNLDARSKTLAPGRSSD